MIHHRFGYGDDALVPFILVEFFNFSADGLGFPGIGSLLDFIERVDVVEKSGFAKHDSFFRKFTGGDFVKGRACLTH